MLHRIVVPEAVNEGLAEELHSMTDGINSDPLAHFAVIFASLIHDLDHTGVGNDDLAKEDPSLSDLYRGRSLAEQKSVDMAWDCKYFSPILVKALITWKKYPQNSGLPFPCL
jgi:hypothetical protein